jgi:thiaminase/transcriptional activator TenA
MVRFSDQAWESTASLREAIHGLPFNTELMAGSLSRERFQTYIVQDAIYLGQFSRALAVAAAKAPDASTMQSFAQSALGAIAVEQALHARFLRDFGMDPAGVADAEPSPDCLAYTSYLIATAYHDPWIDTYSDERFGDSVRAVIAITDRAADTAPAMTRTRMLAAFARACQYEWLFWDGAYQRRGWPSLA